ncbi:MAG: DUF3048 domain-containing protein [Acidimicrobiales bacterium]|jgi:hypothetical protein
MSEQPPRHRRGNGSGNGKSSARSGSRGDAGSGGLGRWLAGLGRRGRVSLAVGAVIILAIVGVVLAAVLSGGNPKAGTNSGSSTTSSSLGTLPSTSIPQTITNSRLCPLTGLPAPSGKAPQRPALAVKIGNDPASRPQSGLDQADIVYEEMAEGGITRYMAVFQCQDAPLIGPVRSVRWDDWNVLEQYRQAILAYSGGIDPWMQEAATLPWIFNANGSFEPTANAYYRYNSSTLPASQGAPYNYYTSTKALWGLFPGAKTLPPRLFRFSKSPPTGVTLAKIVSIPFSSASPVVWKWSRAESQWLRYYDTTPDVDPAGHQIHTTNVVIQVVKTRSGPYNESGPDSRDVESLTVGSGPVYVLRNGRLESGTWDRPGQKNITKLYSADGKSIYLARGQTWWEIVPDYVTVTIKP